MRCLLPSCRQPTESGRYFCPPHKRTAQTGEEGLQEGRQSAAASQLIQAADAATAEALRLLGYRRLSAAIESRLASGVVTWTSAAVPVAPDEGMPTTTATADSALPVAAEEQTLNRGCGSDKKDEATATPCDGTCPWMEGEQFEGKICENCGAHADGKGGVTHGDSDCDGPALEASVSPFAVWFEDVDGGAAGEMGDVQDLGEPRGEDLTKALAPSEPPPAPVWPALPHSLTPFKRGLVLTARQTPGIVLQHPRVSAALEVLCPLGLLQEQGADGALWPVEVRDA